MRIQKIGKNGNRKKERKPGMKIWKEIWKENEIIPHHLT
jgi:hypothetical protein